MHELIFIRSEMDEIKRKKREWGGSGVIELRRTIVLLLAGLYLDEAEKLKERTESSRRPLIHMKEKLARRFFPLPLDSVDLNQPDPIHSSHTHSGW